MSALELVLMTDPGLEPTSMERKLRGASSSPVDVSSNLLCFWGKARPREPANGPTWHPLAFHSLDVAAVGEALLVQQRGPGCGLAHLLGLPSDVAAHVICYLLCLHDIGKFAKKFQAKAPSLCPDCFGDDPALLSASYDHGAGGLRLFNADPDRFELPEGSDDRIWRPLISAVTGHHGAPPDPGPDRGFAALRSDFGRVGIEAAHEFVQRVRPLFQMPQRLPDLDRRRARRASHALAGLAVLADWIGSNQDWFPYREPNRDLETYWCGARERAARAVTEAAVVPARAGGRLDHSDLIGAGLAPSPMQEWTRSAELPSGPTLFMLEDETGSGKTEAALMLAHRLMQGGRADGLYVALPTMATANAMFDRLAVAHRRLFAAVQVAHAITTHRAIAEDDYYTAVDDLKSRDEPKDAGAGFVGVQEFGAGVFYLYICVDRGLLLGNLGDAHALRDASLAALVEAAAIVSPGGKQASFASRARAFHVLAEKGSAQPRSLAAAFLEPVTGSSQGRQSIDVLEGFRARLDTAYGPCADASYTMSVEQGEGTLKDLTAFAVS